MFNSSDHKFNQPWAFSSKYQMKFGDPETSALHKYLRRACIFLPDSTSEDSREILLSKVLVFNQILVTIYIGSWMVQGDENFMVLNSDFNRVMGKHRRAFDLIWFLWALGSSFSGYHIHRNTIRKDHPWWKLSKLLSGRKFYESEDFTLSVWIFEFITNQQALCAPVLVTIQFIFFITLSENFEYWPLTILIFLQFLAAVYMGVSYSVNISPLYCLHTYAYGVVFRDHAKGNSNVWTRKRLRTPSKIESEIMSSVNIYKELIRTQDFYLNSSAYVTTFIAQLFIFYHTLFTELAILTKIEFFLYGTMNWLCGQSLIFLSSWFATNKVEYPFLNNMMDSDHIFSTSR